MKKFLMLITLVSAILYSVSWTSAVAKSENSNDKWLIYWYISGNDLEWADGSATEDMQEMSRMKRLDDSENEINEFDDSQIKVIGTDGEVTFIIPSKDGKDKDQSVTLKTIQFFPKSKTLPKKFHSDVRLSPNVKVLIQTGGCRYWHIQDIPNNTIGRYLFDSNGFHYKGSFADADMGSADTLEDFLRYGKNNIEKDFQPNHRMLIFWGHGGLVRVCLDERYEDDALNLNDIRKALAKVYKATPDNPPFDIIGFDACLRATYENANNIYGFARYMIASEEQESGYGWYYSDWIKDLSENPSISPQNLSKIICESSYNYLKKNNIPDETLATFSTINLSPTTWLPLRTAYDSFMKTYFKASNSYYVRRSLQAAEEDKEMRAESYPITDKYMLDLKTFAEKTKKESLSLNEKDLLDAADDLINAVDSAVVRKNLFNGEHHMGSNGISIYNPFYRDEESLKLYVSQDTISKYTKNLYERLFYLDKEESGSFNLEDNQKARSKNQKKGKQSKGIQSFQEMQDLLLLELEDVDVEYDNDEGEVYLTNFTEDIRKKVSYISGSLAKTIYADAGDKEPSSFRVLGEFSVLNDWNSNKVTCKLPTKWLTLNDYFVYTQILGSVNSKTDANGQVIRKGYTIYGVPIKLNGVRSTLKVVYYPDDSKYQILGASRSMEGTSVGSRENKIPKEGDRITLLFMNLIPSKSNVNNIKPAYSMRYGQSEMDFIWEDGESFTVKENLVADSKTLAANPDDGDGNFAEYNISLELHSLGENRYGLRCPILFCINEEGKIVEIDPDAYIGAFDAGGSIEITDHEENKKYDFNTETGEVTEES